ncbi:MAG: ATP-binding protein [Myxococcales bacterium]|nr:ATP-binding protein [Myxococcales bacterium]
MFEDSPSPEQPKDEHDPAFLRAELARSTHRNLNTVSSGLAAIYLVFALTHTALLPSRSGVVLVAMTLLSAVLFLMYARHAGTQLLSASAAPFVTFMVALVTLTNVSTHFLLMGELLHGYNFMLLNLVFGALILMRSWLLLFYTISLPTSLICVAIAIDAPPWHLAVGGLLGSAVIGLVVQTGRVDVFTRMTGFRLEAETALLASQRSEKIIRRTRRDLLEIIDKAPDGVVVHRHGKIVYANPAFLSWLQSGDNDSLTGSSLVDLVSEVDRASFEKSESNTAARNTREFNFRRTDGQEIVLELASPKTIDFNGSDATLLVARDVTERHAELRARLMLADRMAAVGTLAAGVGHEINNPLAFVTNNLNALRAELDDPALELAVIKRTELREITDECLGGAARIRAIVGDLKTMARADEETRSHLDVRELLESSIKMVAHELRHRSTVRTDFADVPAVQANGARLGQVFVNMLVNAGHAFEEGGREANFIDIRTKTGEQNRVVIEISDNGQGMSEQTRTRLFEPFYTTKPIGVGTGLGLYYCHEAVRGFGGEIDVESELGRGTTFRIALPAAEARPSTKPEVQTRPAPCDRRCRILVIDDEPEVGRSLQRMLKREHDVTLTTSGCEGIETLVSESFDAVICDIMIPDLPGRQIYSRLRELRPGAEDRVIFITGGVFTRDAKDFIASIDNPVLQKPFSPDELRGTLAALVGP